jgi:hypothetical protein
MEDHITIEPKKKCENMKEYLHNYYISKSKETLMKKTICDICKSEQQTSNLPRHTKTKKHQNNLIKIERNVTITI